MLPAEFCGKRRKLLKTVFKMITFYSRKIHKIIKITKNNVETPHDQITTYNASHFFPKNRCTMTALHISIFKSNSYAE